MDGSIYTGGVPSGTVSDTQRAGSHLGHGGKIFIFAGETLGCSQLSWDRFSLAKG